MTYVISVFISFVVAMVTYMAQAQLGEWKKRRDASRLGVAVIDSFLEEIKNGLQMMEAFQKSPPQSVPPGTPVGLMPHHSWEGMQTVSDQVLLRILALFDHETETHETETNDFLCRDIRSHCKNYFENICGNINNYLQKENYSQVMSYVGRERDENTYVKDTEKLHKMLTRAREKLMGNAKKRFRPV